MSSLRPLESAFLSHLSIDRCFLWRLLSDLTLNHATARSPKGVRRSNIIRAAHATSHAGHDVLQDASELLWTIKLIREAQFLHVSLHFLSDVQCVLECKTDKNFELMGGLLDD
jgi:hypothetical protein